MPDQAHQEGPAKTRVRESQAVLEFLESHTVDLKAAAAAAYHEQVRLETSTLSL